MFTIIITLNGSYISYIKWNNKFEFNEILREYGIILISAFNEDVKVMDNYEAQWMCSGKRDFNIEELKSKLDENIRTLLKTHPELDEFTLDKITIQ